VKSATQWTGAAVVGVLIALVVLRSDIGRFRRFDPARDSITVRAYFKPWGGRSLDMDAMDPEWDADSATARGLVGGLLSVREHRPFGWSMKFTVIRAASAESAWVAIAGGYGSLEHRWTEQTDAPNEPVLLTQDVRWWTTNSYDGGSYIGLRLVGTRRVRPSPPAVLYSLSGRVLDADSGLPCRASFWFRDGPAAHVRIHEAWGRAAALTDNLGRFRLEGLREGWVRLNVLTENHSMISRFVHVPADSVVIRLAPGNQSRFQSEVMPPLDAESIIVPIPGVPRVQAARLWPSIEGRWQGDSRCVASPDDARGADEHGVFRFTAHQGYERCGSPIVLWEREGEPGDPPRTPVVWRAPHVLWASATPTEPGGRGWEFAVLGDTLVGQLIDPSTRVVARELFATRIRDSLHPERPGR